MDAPSAPCEDGRVKDFDTLVAQAQDLGRIPSREEAERFLRAVLSTLADWSGAAGEKALAALPRQLARGPGRRGRSFDEAARAAGGARSALLAEVGRRAAQPDPGKVAIALRPVLALLRDALPAADANALAAALPPPVAEELRRATTAAPWGFRLLTQSYARPTHVGPPH